MKKLISWLENDFAPKMNVVNRNVWVVTLKDSIMQVLPFILLGSIFCCLTVPGDVFGWRWWPNFWTPFGWTMGMLSLFVAFLIPFNLMEKKRLRKQRIGRQRYPIPLLPQQMYTARRHRMADSRFLRRRKLVAVKRVKIRPIDERAFSCQPGKRLSKHIFIGFAPIIFLHGFHTRPKSLNQLLRVKTIRFKLLAQSAEIQTNKRFLIHWQQRSVQIK